MTQVIVYAERLDDGSLREIAQVPVDAVHEVPQEYLNAVKRGRNECYLQDAPAGETAVAAVVEEPAAESASDDAPAGKVGKGKSKGKGKTE